MNSVDRDISRAECFLIALYGEYVEYSKKFVWVNLNSPKRLKENVSSEHDNALETDDLIHIYAERDTNQNFIQLCNDYPHKFEWHCHPKHISLREFVAFFNKKWALKR